MTVNSLFYISVRDNFAKNNALVYTNTDLDVNNSTMTKFDAIIISSKESPILASLQDMEFSLHHLVSIVLFQI